MAEKINLIITAKLLLYSWVSSAMQFCSAVLVAIICKGDLGGGKGRDGSSIPASVNISCDLSL